jgi:hypothetical protein
MRAATRVLDNSPRSASSTSACIAFVFTILLESSRYSCKIASIFVASRRLRAMRGRICAMCHRTPDCFPSATSDRKNVRYGARHSGRVADIFSIASAARIRTTGSSANKPPDEFVESIRESPDETNDVGNSPERSGSPPRSSSANGFTARHLGSQAPKRASHTSAFGGPARQSSAGDSAVHRDVRVAFLSHFTVHNSTAALVAFVAFPI